MNVNSTFLACAMLSVSVALVISYYIPAFTDDAKFSKTSHVAPLGPYYYLNEMASADLVYILIFMTAGAAQLFCNATRWHAVIHTVVVIIVITYQFPISATIVAFWVRMVQLGQTKSLVTSAVDDAYLAGNVIRLLATIFGLIVALIALMKWWKDTIIYQFGSRRRFHLLITVIAAFTAFIYLVPMIAAYVMVTYGDVTCQYPNIRADQLLFMASDATYKFGPAYFNVFVVGIGAISYIFEVDNDSIKPVYKSYMLTVLLSSITVVMLEQASKITAYYMELNSATTVACINTILKIAIGSHACVMACNLIICVLLMINLIRK